MSVDMFKVRGINVANIHNNSGIAFFGICVLAGSNYETPDIAGISHFAEHLFFKGTATRNYQQINEEFAKLGVSQNAYTNNTEVMYHATCPRDNLSKVIALMTDMFFNSNIPIEEMEKERSVIAEEKKMYDDDPKSAFSNAISSKFFDWNVGHDIIGTFETIKSISRDQVLRYLKRLTNLDNFVFVCSGDVKSEDLRQYIETNIPESHDYLTQGDGLHTLDTSKMWNKTVTDCEDKIKFLMERDNITQSIVYMIIDALPMNHSLYFAESVLYEAIGGGMYSRLFSRIREELGLCYSVGMFPSALSYPEKRIASLYGFASPENVDRFILESENVLKDVMENGISQDLFECAKTTTLCNVLRRTETSEGKATYLTKRILTHKKADLEEHISKIKAVTIEDCNIVAKKMLETKYNWAVMNPKKEV